MRFIRFVLTSAFFLALAFAVAGWYISNKYSKEIQKLVLTELNKQLNAEVNVESIDISSFKKIPYLSLSFSNVLVKESKLFSKTPDTLLFAKDLSFQFNLWDVYNEKYELKHLDVLDAVCYMKEGKKGASNYKIWRETSDTTSTNFSFKMDEINLSEITYSYKDFRNKVFVKSFVSKLKVHGDFDAEELSLKFKGNLKKTTVLSSGVYALRNQSLQLNSGIIYHNDSETFELENGKVMLDNEVELDLGGYVANNSFQFKAQTDKARLEKVLALLPESWDEYWENYKPIGNASIDFTIGAKGKETPKIDILFALNDAEIITSGERSVKLSKLNLKGLYTNGKNRNLKSSSVKLSAVSGKFPSGEFVGNVSVSNFSDLRIKGELEGDLKLHELVNFLKVETIDSCAGDVIFKLKGDVFWDRIKQESVVVSKSELEGAIDFSDVSLKLKNNYTSLANYQGKIRFNKQQVEFEKSEGMLNSSRFILNGSADNFFQWAIEGDDLLRIVASVKADKLALEEFLSTQNTSDNNNSRSLAIPGVELQLNADIDELTYQEFKATKISTKLFIGQKSLKANPISLEAMEGMARGKLALIKHPSGGYGLSFMGDFEQVNVQEMFRQFKNFGQDEIKSENIEGIADMKLNLESSVNNDFELISESVFANANLNITQGKLVNYTTLQSISDYFKTNIILKKVFHAEELSKNLQSVSFQKLENDLFIRNSKLIIPKVELRSSVLNVNVAGSHGFNDSIDYKLDFDISDLMIKDRNYSTEHGEVLDDGTGRYRVFMLVSGTTENMDISLDKSSKKAYKKQQREKEGKELKEALNNEFGWFNKDTTLHRKEHKTKFDIEWEEADSDTTVYSKVEVETKHQKKKKKRGWLTPNEEEKEFIEFEDDDF